MNKETKKNVKSSVEAFLKKATFDVEHALGMYAISFCTIPAEGIYDKDALEPLMSIIDTCHIYLVGYTPKIQLIEATQKDSLVELKFETQGAEYKVSYEIPIGLSLIAEDEHYYLQDALGSKYSFNEQELHSKLALEINTIKFEVKYIGQAYGKEGSRNAIDRLIKHETLQKIALKGIPDGYRLTLLMLAVQPNNQLITSINPFAKNLDDGESRIESGLSKLFNTSEAERISLYEAALIRYFYPEYNKEFKDSFPSTNLKILQDCYMKDFCAIIAEINIDELPFELWSSKVKASSFHIAKYNLHKDEERRMFFGI